MGQVAQWSARHCGAAPSWFSTKSLGFPIANHDQVTLRMELWDDYRLLGTSASKLSFLPAHETITQELDSAAELRDDEPCVLRFQVLDSSQVLAPRTVYFIRHAQSVWNQAQGKLNLYEMGRVCGGRCRVTKAHPRRVRPKFLLISHASVCFCIAGAAWDEDIQVCRPNAQRTGRVAFRKFKMYGSLTLGHLFEISVFRFW